MSDYLDEVGHTLGPQGAAKAALEVELAGMEPPRSSTAGSDDAGESPGAPPCEAAAGPEEWESILRSGFGALFALLSARWKSFEAQPEELDALAKAWTPVAVKHAGGTIPIEAIAALATVAIVAPKVVGAYREEKQRKAAARAEAQHRDPGTHHA